LEIRFGTSGLRGLTDIDITEELCWRVGSALAEYLGASRPIAIGHDTRPGASRLAAVCAAAMESRGAAVLNLGVAPSPAVCAMIRIRECGGGLVVTGSHLPYDRIGLIPLDAEGAIPPRPETNRLADMVAGTPDHPATGSALPTEHDYYLEFLEFVQKQCGTTLPGKGVSVALDTAGATGACIVPRLMNDLGCEAHAAHDSRLDFAPRKMEPRADCVAELSGFVREKGADFGAAYDSDCDRVLFVDEAGTPLSEDLAAAIFAKYLYGGGPGVLVTPVNSSGLIRKVWAGEVRECVIGPPEISHAARRSNARFAYEESGKYFFMGGAPWADGILATAMMAKVLGQSRKRLSVISREFPAYVQVKRNVKGDVASMEGIIHKVRESFKPDGATLNDIDGLKYVFADGSWLLIRASGTEPLVRVYTDSHHPFRAKELSEMGVEAVRKAMG
jgi:phosphomannomutase/phosphoglucomutase